MYITKEITMTQEDKELLLRDLSARLTYGVIVDYKEDEYDFHHWKISTLHAPAYSQSGSLINTGSDGWIEYEEYKGCGMSTGSRPLHIEITLPFLRPMSSMTKEEKKEFSKLLVKRYCEEDWEGHISTSYCIEIDNVYTDDEDGIKYPSAFSIDAIDWLNAHHFDYRGLIEKGLALIVPADMYN
jgi:hypothetical protein